MMKNKTANMKMYMQNYMTTYLKVPENKSKHNKWSNSWYVNKYNTNKAFRTKRIKYITKYNKNNQLQAYLYAGLNYKIRMQEDPIAYFMYYQFIDLAKKIARILTQATKSVELFLT